MAQRKYQVNTACPQCGCSAVSHLSKEEMEKRFGHVPNVEMTCSECMETYHASMADACPEWDRECRMAQ